MQKKWKQLQILSFWPPKSLWMATAVMELKDTCSLGRKAITNLDNILKSRDITLPTKIHVSYHFSSGQVQMWELDFKEGWALKNWCFWTVVLEKPVESPLYCKEIKPVNPPGNQSWIFIGRTDAEAEAPMLWPPDANSWLTGKDPDAGKVWGQEEKGTTEDEMVLWHHRLNGHRLGGLWELVWTGRPGMLQFMGSQKSDMTEWLNWLTGPYSITNLLTI